MEFLLQLLIALAVLFLLARLGSAIVSRFGLPGLIGEIVIGIVVANLAFGDWSLMGSLGITMPEPGEGAEAGSDVYHIIYAMAELGVVFLLFTVGLETKVKDLLGSGRPALLCAILGVILPFIAGFILYKTRWGLNVRAIGDNPQAAETAGISVIKVKYQTVILSGIFACLAGGMNAVLSGIAQKLPTASLEDPSVKALLRESMHRLLYFSVNSRLAGVKGGSGLPVYVLLLVLADVLVFGLIAWGTVLKLLGYRLANADVLDEKKARRHRIHTIVYWSVVAAVVVAVLIVFFTWGLPLLRQALKIQ